MTILTRKSSTLLSRFKNRFVSSDKKPRVIRFGPFKGIRMNLALSSQTQLTLGLYEAEINPWLRKLSKGIRSAVNIGAAYGEQTLFFLVKTPAERVFSYEPEDETREQLLSNLKLNGMEDTDRLRLSSKFVGSSDDARTCALNSIASSLPMPCLVMMDVEGHEVNVLRGADALLKSTEVRWIIETHSEPLERQCIHILRQAGFDTKIVPNAWWRVFLPELRPSTQNRWLIATGSAL